MAELTQEEKNKLFEKLPKELQELMQSEDTGAFLWSLGIKYGLNTDKIHLLSKLVGDVVLGITPVTSLAQEINLKITANSQIAMNLSQELYADLLSPVISKTPTSPQASIKAPAPQAPIVPPAAPITKPQIPDTKYQIPAIDRYREPTNGASGIVDLRKMPPAVSKIEPLSPPAIKVEPPAVSRVEPPPPLPRPLTFTKPAEPIKSKPPIPLIEAEPHRQQPVALPAEKPMINLSRPPVLERTKSPVASGVEPQYIIRPPGLAPTDLPRNILDLKRDKGEF